MASQKISTIVFSGIGPGSSGVGRFIQSLIALYGCRVFSVYAGASLRQAWSSRRFDILLKELLKRGFSKLFFITRSFLTRRKNVILVHPQTIGLRTFKRLCRNNHVSVFLVDNFWFCKKSYNHKDQNSCLLCVKDIHSTSLSCQSAPIPYSHRSYLDFYTFLKDADISFLVQTEAQKKLLLTHLDRDAPISVVGLPTSELGKAKDESFGPVIRGNSVNRVLLHASTVDAKGFTWFIELANQLPDVTFIVPSLKPHRVKDSASNILWCPASWDHGLQEIMASVDLVLCPSLWSSVIEGALIKSLWFHGRVGVVDVPYAYGASLSSDIVLKLSLSVEEAADQIRLFDPLSIQHSKIREAIYQDNKRSTTAFKSELLLFTEQDF